jgi:ClpP class serine protease
MVVAKNRGLSLAQVMKLATGDVYPLSVALEGNLVDAQGDLHDAIDYACAQCKGGVVVLRKDRRSVWFKVVPLSN